MSTTSKDHTEFVAEGESPQRRRFPWWVLLLAVALVAVVLWLIARGGEDAALPGATGGDTTAETDAGANPDVAPGKVTAGGATIYPLQDDLTVADYKGQSVIGTAVRVESVVAENGFWIGENAQDRIFVLVTDGAAQVQAGDVIDFEGVVVAHGDDFAEEVGVDADEGAARLKALRGHIEIAQLRPSD